MQALLKSVQDFVSTEEGRWACIALLAGLVLLLAWRAALRRWNQLPRELTNLELLEEVAVYPPAPPLSQEARPLLLYGLPVRIRLMVLGPLGHDAGSLEPEDVNSIVERMVPGLSNRLVADLPRVRLWPTQLSQAGFVAALRRNTPLPESEARVRLWVLVMGKVLWKSKPIAVGMALQSTEPNTLGPVVLQHAHQWMEVLRFGQL